MTTAPTDARARLATILNEGGLKLPRERGAASPYAFSVWLAPSQASRTEGAELRLHADGKSAAVASRSKDGLPFSVAKDDRYVQLDPNDPGGVILCTGGRTSAEVGGSETGLKLRFHYGADAVPPGVQLDLAPILQRVLDRAKEGKVDAKTGGLLFSLPDHVVAVRRAAERENGFPIRDVVFLTRDAKVVFSVSDVRVDQDVEAPPSVPTVEELQRAGFRVKELRIEELPQRFPMPPSGFWNREDCVAAAERLHELLNPRKGTEDAKQQ